jgi:hypothetical protein
MLELMSGGDLRGFFIDGGQFEESTAKYYFCKWYWLLNSLTYFFLIIDY